MEVLKLGIKSTSLFLGRFLAIVGESSRPKFLDFVSIPGDLLYLKKRETVFRKTVLTIQGTDVT